MKTYSKEEVAIIEMELKDGSSPSQILKKFAGIWGRPKAGLLQKIHLIKGGKTWRDLVKPSVLDAKGYEELVSASIGGIEDEQILEEGRIVRELHATMVKNSGELSGKELSKAKKSIYMKKYYATLQKEKQEVLNLANPSDLFQLAELANRISTRKVEIQYHLDELRNLLNNL